MGYLLGILAALAAHGVVEGGGFVRLGPVWVVPALLGLPYLVAWLAYRLGSGGRFTAAARVGRAMELLPPVLHYLALGSFGWQEAVEGWLGEPISLLDWPRASLLLLLAPFVAFTLALIDAQARAQSRGDSLRQRLRRFQTRMFAGALSPLVIYVLLAAAVGTSPALRMRIETVALWNACFMLGLLTMFALGLPFLLRNTWETAPLAPGPQRAVLEAVAERARFRCRELLVWRTGNLVANAAIVGLTGRDRVVVFTDSLLAQLGPRQLAAVFAHEIGHAKGRHVLIFLSWAGATFLGADLVVRWIEPEQEWVGLAVIGAALLLWAVGFGWMSRRFELEADLHSLRLLGDPLGLASALEQVGGHAPEVTGWRHFSIGVRVRYIARVVAEPELGRRLQRRLRRIAYLGFVLFALVLALQLRGLVQGFPADQVTLDLRLGRYGRAESGLERVSEPSEDLTRLVRLGAQLPEDRAAPLADRLWEAARTALARGDVGRAGDILLLGELAEEAELARAREVLTLSLEGLAADAERLAQTLPEAWRAPLLAARAPEPGAQ